ncbi:MAG: hypothetical protein K0R39_2585 [Symbiobacteriaceae bacterium]|jgi:hypothetical protein|nr:hypothetical protein [Symbiobacteriaceae bacterium]
MKRFLAVCSLLLLAGCAAQPAPDSEAQPASGTTGQVQAPQTTPAATAPAPAPQVVAVPTPEEMCQKPEDGSDIIFGVMPGDGDSELGMKPGWTRPLPARWFGVSLRFDKSVKVDPASFVVKVEPARWQPVAAQATGKPDWMHIVNVLPDGEMKEGPAGWVTVTVEKGSDMAGKSLIPKPVSIRLFMQEPLKPGETGVPCPAGDLIPPPAGGH